MRSVGSGRTQMNEMVMVGSDRGGRPLVFATLIDERPHKNGARESVGRVGRRSALLYGTGELFACRHCYGLTYASQREALHLRGLAKAQKIRMRLGGSPESEEVPDKPKGMHWRTYDRLCLLHDAAEERSTIGLMHFVGRLGRRTSRRA